MTSDLRTSCFSHSATEPEYYTEAETESFQTAAAKEGNAYEWLRNFLPSDKEGMVNFLRERMEK